MPASRIIFVLNTHPLENASFMMGRAVHKRLKGMGVDVGDKPVIIGRDKGPKLYTGADFKAKETFGVRGYIREETEEEISRINPKSTVITFHGSNLSEKADWKEWPRNFLREKELNPSESVFSSKNPFFLLRNPGLKNLFTLEMVSPSRPSHLKQGNILSMEKMGYLDAQKEGFFSKRIVNSLAQKLCAFVKEETGNVPMRGHPGFRRFITKRFAGEAANLARLKKARKIRI